MRRCRPRRIFYTQSWFVSQSCKSDTMQATKYLFRPSPRSQPTLSEYTFVTCYSFVFLNCHLSIFQYNRRILRSSWRRQLAYYSRISRPQDSEELDTLNIWSESKYLPHWYYISITFNLLNHLRICVRINKILFIYRTIVTHGVGALPYINLVRMRTHAPLIAHGHKMSNPKIECLFDWKFTYHNEKQCLTTMQGALSD